MNNKLLKNDSGQGMVEYGLILALVSVVSIGALTGVGGGVKDKLEQVSGALRGEGVTDSPSNVGIYSDDELDNLIENENHIPIASAVELDNIRNNTKQTFGAGTKWEGEYTSGLDKEYIQVSDIDLSGNDSFEPIGNNDKPFTGKYDGGGYAINNLTIDRPSERYVGLFGWTDGSRVENVGLNALVVIGNSHVGGLIGRQNNLSTTMNSYAKGSVSGEGRYVGGLIGQQWDSSTMNSYASGSVTGIDQAGGLIGSQAGSSTTVNSYASGKVTGNKQVGGLLGYADDGSINNSGWDNEVNDGIDGIGRTHSDARVRDVKGYSTEEINGIIKDLIK